MSYRYDNVLVTDVYDGDTITVKIDLGFHTFREEKLRLFGINAPEMRGAEKAEGTKSRDWLRERILDQVVELETIKDKKGKYGRYLAIIYRDEVNINNEMVDKKLAVFKKY